MMMTMIIIIIIIMAMTITIMTTTTNTTIIMITNMQCKRQEIRMIFVLAGTSDARALSLEIKKGGFDLLASVVTENAAVELRESGIPVQVGRLTDEDMVGLIDTKGILAV